MPSPRRLGCDVDIGIRLALDLDPLADQPGVPMHGPGTMKEQSDSTKWGMTRAQTVEIVKQALDMPNMNLKETHFHLSRMSNDPVPFAVMAREMITWSGHIREHTGWTPPTIDIGGGWTYGTWYGTGPNSQIDDDRAPTPEDYARLTSEAIKDEAKKLDLPLPKLQAGARAAASPARPALRSALSARSRSATTRSGSISTSPPTTCRGRRCSTGTITPCRWWMPGPRRPRPSTWSVRSAIPTRSARTAGCRQLKRGDHVAFLDAGGYCESSAARYNAQLLPATVAGLRRYGRPHHHPRAMA